MTAKGEGKPVRVRIAPSPTGFLHIGTARSALYDYLFAKKHNGAFILRIEDTDKERSTPEFEADIMKSLLWLGLTWDEGPMPDGTQKGEYGPYRQSERTPIYKGYLEELLSAGNAYYCFCTKDELESVRQSQMTQGQAPTYNGKCRSIPKDEALARITKGDGSVIRFKTPATKITFTDLIRGEVTFDNALLGDIVIAKSITEPLFILSNLIDDELMKISHVIRGEDHLANTPKQIIIAKALGFTPPQFGHLPLILNPDRSKMSKRAGPTAVSEYMTDYLPEAIINFIALLGWHPADDNEVLSITELTQQFEIGRVQKAGAIFNIEKLKWFNNYYLRKQSTIELAKRLTTSTALIDLFKDRASTLSELKNLANEVAEPPPYQAALLIWKKGTPEGARTNLEACKMALLELHDAAFTKEAIERSLAGIIATNGKGDVLWPLRVSLSGKEASPGPFELAAALGKTESIHRIDRALLALSAS